MNQFALGPHEMGPTASNPAGRGDHRSDLGSADPAHPAPQPQRMRALLASLGLHDAADWLAMLGFTAIVVGLIIIGFAVI